MPNFEIFSPQRTIPRYSIILLCEAQDTMLQGADFDFAGPAQDLAEANANALTAADLHNTLLGQTPAQQQLLQQKAKEQDLINAAANGAAPYSQNLLTKPLFPNQTCAGSQTYFHHGPSQAKHFEPYETDTVLAIPVTLIFHLKI